ncbi:MAG: glutamine amidotransferase [Victivallaceae bacterium]|jgi:hypothetical protein
MKKYLLISFLLLTAVGVLHCGEPAVNISFNNYPEGKPVGEKWSVHQPESNKEASTYVIKNGKLEVTSSPAEKLQGGYIETEIPVIRKGSVEFDLNVNHNEQGIGLFIEFYNITLFWHDYCKDWRRYFPEATAKRIKYFNNEPVGHRRLSNVEKNKWLHYKIYFDTDNDLVEYYQGDMVDPVYIDGAAAILGRQEYLGGKLRIGCWGVTEKPMKFLIDNIVISKVSPNEEQSSSPRNDYIIFNGISFNRYNIAANLLKNGVSDKEIRNYYIENTEPALTPENKFFINRLPGSVSMQKAKACILVDCPFGPNQVIPDFVLKNIIANVKNGMNLIILGGLFSLDKGEYQTSYLNDFLPVKIKDAWQVKGSSAPLLIEPSAQQFGNIDWKEKPCVYYRHDLAPAEDAEVLLKAGGYPLLVSKKYGKGKIVVFLGTVCGTPAAQPPAFWKWKNWPELTAGIIMINNPADQKK